MRFTFFKIALICLFAFILKNQAIGQACGTSSTKCPGTYSYTYSGSYTAPLSWSISGNNSVSFSGTNALTASVTLTGAGACVLFLEDRYGQVCSWNITVQASSGGTVSASTTEVCPGGNVTLSLNGAAGSIVRWEKSTNGGTSYSTISSTSNPYTATNVTVPTRFRAITSNACSSAKASSVSVINIVPGVSITGGGTFCSGEAFSGNLNANYTHEGATLKRWEQSVYSGAWGAWSAFSPNPSVDYVSISTSVRTKYRAVINPGTGGCSELFSNEVEVYPVTGTVAGYITGHADVCSNAQFTLQVQGNTGNVTGWLMHDDLHPSTWASVSPPFQIQRTTTFKAQVTNSGCSTKETPETTVGVLPAASVTLSANATSVCDGGSYVLSLSANGVTSVQWQRKKHATDDDTWETVATNNDRSYTASNVQRAWVWRVVVSGSCGGNVTSGEIVILYNGSPPQTPTNVSDQWVNGNSQVVLKVAPEGDGSTAQWYTNAAGTGTPVGTGTSLVLTPPITNYTYYVRGVNEYNCASALLSIAVRQLPVVPTSVLKTEIIRTGGVADPSQITALPDAQLTTAYSYFDGFGRGVQTTAMRASPLGKDLVQPMEYDELGRVSKKYMSYASSTTTGSYHANYVTEQLNFYSAPGDKVANDAKPYTSLLFENSPLGRPTEQGTGAWQPGTNHSDYVSYSYNNGSVSSPAEEVRRFNPDGTSTGFYAANQLTRLFSRDADGHIQIIYKDGAGNTVAKKQQLEQVIDGTLVNWLETYYIYDLIGRIKLTLSPKGVAVLKANSWNLGTAIENYAHQVVYDERGRVVEMKAPGQAWTYTVYDRMNRVVLSQDGIQRTTKKWSFIKYDQRGRAVMQGMYLNNTQTTRAAMQLLVNSLYKTTNATYPEDAWYETRGTSLHGYSNISFPKTNADNSALEVWNVSYYDNYDFDNSGTADYNYTNQALANENTPAAFTHGLSTGTKKLILGAATTTWLYTYLFYDENGRVIQVRSNNQLNSAVDNLITSVYDFEGKVILSKTDHKGGTGKESTIVQRHSYDHSGRLKNIYRPIAQAENIVWTNGTGIQAAASSIQKTTGAANWDAGAFSSNSLAAGQDGWLEFSTGEANTSKMAGLSDQDVGVSYKTIDYAINLTSNGSIKIYENNVLITTPLITYTAADVFSLERKNGVVRYKKNNAIIYTSAIASTGALFADASLFTLNATVSNVTFYREVEKTVVQYEYNELGQVVDKKLHNTTGSNFLQSVDYRYTLLGQLESINNAQLTADGGVVNEDADSDQTDYFGMEYLYGGTDGALGNTAVYNGNISAVKWKGAGAISGAADQKSYKYTYDKSDKLLTATSQMYAGSWNKEANALNESMSYDHNGNIKTLQRNKRRHQLSGLAASYLAEATDNLTYTYNTTTGDQLEKVTDAATPLADTGFSNGSSGTATDYTYDANGNVITDLNKGFSGITYNLLGKPAQVNFSDGRKISYMYDATGSKLTMKTWQGTTLLATTDYMNGFEYENGNLRSYAAPEGRVVMKGTNPEYQYAIADHQGNTRVVFSSTPVATQSSTADMEAVSNGEFDNYPTGGNHSSVSIYNHTPAGTYSQLLNGGNNSQVGLAKSYKVYPGDKVKIEAYAKYANLTNNASNVSAFASALLNAFLLPAPLAGETGTVASALNDWGSVVAAGGDGQSNAAPHVSVNIIVFDKNFNFLDAAYEQIDAAAEQVGVTPVVDHDYLTKEYTVKEEGYVFMYIANENETQVDAYFDDVAMTYTPTNVVQYNEYYPFGLQTSTSWTRDNNSNNYLYNAGNELNSTTGMYETFFRGYDPALGRFMQVDPLAIASVDWSSYNYAKGNPVYFNDPLGARERPPQDRNWLINYGCASCSWGANVDGRFVNDPNGGGGGSYGEGGSSMSWTSFMNAALHGDNSGGTWSNGEGSFYSFNEALDVAYSSQWQTYVYGDESGTGVIFENRLVHLNSSVQTQNDSGEEDKWNNDMFDKWPPFWETAMGKDIMKALPIAEDKWNNDMFDKWPAFWQTAMGKDIIKTFPILGPSKNREELGNMAEDAFLEGLLDGVLDKLPSKLWPFKIPIFIPDEWEKPLPPFVRTPK